MRQPHERRKFGSHRDGAILLCENTQCVERAIRLPGCRHKDLCPSFQITGIGYHHPGHGHAGANHKLRCAPWKLTLRTCPSSVATTSDTAALVMVFFFLHGALAFAQTGQGRWKNTHLQRM